ncbi:EAL domain-containing protein [uncultured Desulfobulbus sp.]|uniref:putative bifunctional diguanylate cyclase/phosphodiesterase n=1 Tax=uncultured Desulfobulbus sp. TaxID=239745 RepID=UPI0029C79CB4|nr:EAL domain-containing protein [uncultured Desulfobulbus sp.]
MNRSSVLLQAAYAACRFLIQERDLPALLQGLCDRLAGHGVYSSALVVLLDQEAGGMITAETGLGEHITPVMGELREGRLPDCGARVLQSDSNEAVLCAACSCRLCSMPGEPVSSLAFCAPLRCSSSLSGFFILQLPPSIEPAPEEAAIVTELAEAITQALRQLFVFEAVKFREQELKQAEERYELALHASQAGLWDWNIKTGEMYTSPDQWELLDYREGSGNPATARRFIHPEDRERVLALLNEHLAGSTEEYRIEYRVREQNGEWAWFLDRGRVVERDENNMPVRMTGTHQNITLQKRQEQALAVVQQQLHDAVDVERNFLQTVIDSAGDPVMVIDLDFNLLLINQAAALLVRGNGEIETLQGRKCHQLFCGAGTPCQDLRFPCPVTEIRNQQQPATLIHNPYHGNSVNNTFELEVSPLRDGQGQLYGIIEVARDITDRLRIEKELRDSQSHLYRLAHHDTLTGLPNRLLFRDRLTQSISKAERNRTGVAILFLDLDRFKNINDTLGHDVGDALLVEVAVRLQRQCRQSDTVARLGGDEFVFVLEAVGNRKDAAVVAEKIMAALAEPIAAKGHALSITTSIGIAIFPGDSDEIEGVIKCADIALYSAKEFGRSNFQFYRREIADNGRRLQLDERQFREAMQSGALRLDYVPQYALNGGQLVGFESQIHWNHPQMGRLLPDAFLAAAEECGMLAAVSLWGLEKICLTLQSWQEQEAGCVPIVVPITSRQLLDPDFFPLLEQLLARYAISPGLLMFGLREQAVADASAQELEVLGRIGRLGIGLAVDDFGAGRCSLVRLQQVAIRRLAVNRQLLACVPADQQAATLVAAIIALAHTLGLTVLADGVEQEEQLVFLRAHGCDQAQGPQLGAPLAGEKAFVLLQSRAKGG